MFVSVSVVRSVLVIWWVLFPEQFLPLVLKEMKIVATGIPSVLLL